MQRSKAGQWIKGHSGNPTGASASTMRDIADLKRYIKQSLKGNGQDTHRAIDRLMTLSSRPSTPPGDVVKIFQLLFAYGYGKPRDMPEAKSVDLSSLSNAEYLNEVEKAIKELNQIREKIASDAQAEKLGIQ